jgi:hypothetical protein
MLPGLRSAFVLRVYLGPQQLASVLLHGSSELPGSAQCVELDNPGGHWQAAIEALRGQILQARVTAAPADLTLEISLSSRWCQLVLAPWSDALLSPPDAARFLQTQLAALYGDLARTWQIVADDAPYGHPRTVCGTDALLIEALKALAADQSCRCQIIEPALATAQTALAASRTRTAAGPAHSRKVPHALAMVEAGRITMVTIQSGHITAIQSQPCGLTWQLELPQAWQRWTLRAPELAAIESVAVIDLSPPRSTTLALAPPPLPPRFRLEANIFGTPEATPKSTAKEAA